MANALDQHPRTDRVKKGNYRGYRIYVKPGLFRSDTGLPAEYVWAYTIAEGVKHLDNLLDDAEKAQAIRDAHAKAVADKEEQKKRDERGREDFGFEFLQEKLGNARAFTNPKWSHNFEFDTKGFISVNIKDMAERGELTVKEVEDWKASQKERVMKEIDRLQTIMKELDDTDAEKVVKIVNETYIPYAKGFYFDGVE